MVSGSGPLANVDYVPLSGYTTDNHLPPKGGLAAPLKGDIPSAPAPEGGAGVAQGGVSAACIVISGQQLSTPKKMVGTGPECDPGDWVPRAAVCPKCGHHIMLVRSGCGLVDCPRCSKRWARRAAERAAARVYGAFHAQVAKHKPRHITFEIPWWTGAKGDWDRVKAYALDTVGATGGLLVVHPWRIKDACQREWEQERDKKTTTLNRYDWVKKHKGMDGFDWAPHCHSMAYGKFTEVRSGSEIFLYRNIRRVNGLHALEGVITYLMTHTFAPTGHEQVYRYFGICSPQKLKPEWTGEISEPIYCEHCGTRMVEEGTNELVLHRHYISLGWHRIRPKPRHVTGGACQKAAA